MTPGASSPAVNDRQPPSAVKTAATAPLPVSVLVPTRNAMTFLPRHRESMEKWLDLVQEVIVVDSDSRDGTVELLREKLARRNARFFSHPPGLYQSWNHGIRQSAARYTYVSTVGDEISREGLVHLVEVAERFSCDVVISPPDFVDELGKPVSGGVNWPVHHMISFLRLEQHTCLEGLLPFEIGRAHV
jgi:glycosyltransferase involved in cell wall biosynthesis